MGNSHGCKPVERVVSQPSEPAGAMEAFHSADAGLRSNLSIALTGSIRRGRIPPTGLRPWLLSHALRA